MYTTRIKTANTGAFRIGPNEAPFKKHGANEADLVARLQAGDETAFRQIIARYAAKIHRVCYGILRNREDADDVAQDVFTPVYFSVKGFGARSSLYGWLDRIAVNKCYEFLRQRRFKLVHSSASPDGALTARMEAIADGRLATDRTAMQRDFINKLLARIPEDDRWLLIWKEVEGFSLAELSEMTRLNEGTLKVRLFRVRQRLATDAAGCATGLARPAERRQQWPTSVGGTISCSRSRNILVGLTVKCYMIDAYRKRTGNRLVGALELRLSSNVATVQRSEATQGTLPMARVHLTTKESQRLQLLADNPGRIFSRDVLHKIVWGYADGVMSRTVDVHIQHLRKKLKGHSAPTIHTIFGQGWVLEHSGRPLDSSCLKLRKTTRP
jgi:RNA polymerase sigma-70 factor (ECF subfamily)